jgi:hypothetical protein
MGNYNSFRESNVFGMNNKREQKGELGVRATIEGEFWSMLEILWRIFGVED